MVELGALRSRLRVALVGGAQILLGRAFTDAPQIGPRNVEAVLAALSVRGLHPQEQEVGGSHGRTVTLSVSTGELRVLTAGKTASAA
jgi:chemotaxis protein CheD